MYAKIIDGKLEFAPRSVLHNGKTVINPSPTRLKELGYKNFIDSNNTLKAKDGYKISSKFKETKTQIERVWAYSKLTAKESTEAQKQVVLLEIAELELFITNRRLREAAIDLPGAKDFIKEIDDKISALREKLKD